MTGTMRYQSSPLVTACPLGDGLAIFDSRSNSYFSLNRSGALLWTRAGQPASLAELRQAVARAYAKTEDEIAQDIDRAVAALLDAQLLTALPQPGAEVESAAGLRSDDGLATDAAARPAT